MIWPNVWGCRCVAVTRLDVVDAHGIADFALGLAFQLLVEGIVGICELTSHRIPIAGASRYSVSNHGAQTSRASGGADALIVPHIFFWGLKIFGLG
ncbi:MAG: hypothetical protein WCO86_10345 [Planctomycetota bacterium]